MTLLGLPSVAALIWLLAIGAAHGDDTDIDCSGNFTNGVPNTKFTKYFCRCGQDFSYYFNSFTDYFGQWTGWFFILLYHALMLERAVMCKTRTVKANWENVVRTVGQNMLVYSCYKGSPEHYKLYIPFMPFSSGPFMQSWGLIFIDMVLLWGLRTYAEKMMSPPTTRDEEDVTFGMTDKALTRKLWEHLDNTFTMPDSTMLSVFLKLVTQSGLFFLYCLVMNQGSESIKRDCQALMWMLGVLVMYTAGEAQSGNQCDLESWHKIHYSLESDACKAGKAALLIRMFADWIVNSIYRQVLLSTTPMLLSSEGPMDFIKDVLAVIFIVTLDDASDAQKDELRDIIFEKAKKERPSASYVKDREDFEYDVPPGELAELVVKMITEHPWTGHAADDERTPNRRVSGPRSPLLST